MAAGALVEEVAEEVATNLEEVAAVTRRVDAAKLGYFGIGMGVGFAFGFYWGFKFNREKIRAEVLKEAEEQIDQIRAVYQQKTLAAENQDKPSAEEIVERRGYSTREPEPERALRPPVPIVVTPPPVVIVEEPVSEEPDWIWAQEMAKRSEAEPYIIHEDEFVGGDKAYNQTQYTYWAGDDVLTDTNNVPIPHPTQVVGRDNLRFGHGAGSPDIVFVRNDRLELDIEIDREPGSYEEEILGKTRPVEDGLEHSSQSRPARKKPKHHR
jgi:hypothetical protein